MDCSINSLPHIFWSVKKYATPREVAFGFRVMNLWVKDAADPAGRPNPLIRTVIRVGRVPALRIGAGRDLRCNHRKPCRRSRYHTGLLFVPVKRALIHLSIARRLVNHMFSLFKTSPAPHTKCRTGHRSVFYDTTSPLMMGSPPSSGKRELCFHRKRSPPRNQGRYRTPGFSTGP